MADASESQENPKEEVQAINFDDEDSNFEQVPDSSLQKFTKFGGFGVESYNREDVDVSSGMDVGPQI